VREEGKREERGGRKGCTTVQVRVSDGLNHTTYSGVTDGHMTQGGWAVSRATAVDTTESWQTPVRLRHTWYHVGNPTCVTSTSHVSTHDATPP
jgi:hypothetical protein